MKRNNLDLICGAKLRNKNKICLRKTNGENRCKFHGGLSLKGDKHYKYKTGRFCKENIKFVKENKHWAFYAEMFFNKYLK